MAAASTARSKIIFLTGAPDLSEVTDSRVQLLDALVPALNRFVNPASTRHIPDLTPSHPWPCWRALQTGQDALESHTEKRKHQPAQEHLSFLSTGSANTQDGVNHHFLEHSLAAFTSGAKLPQTELASNNTSFDSTFAQESFLSDVAADAEELFIRTTDVPTSFTNLSGLPTAMQLEKCYPQTVTVNLVVGIISLAPARTIHLRRLPHTMQLIEVIVGDETRTGPSPSAFGCRQKAPKPAARTR
jgi:hypothetical protein